MEQTNKTKYYDTFWGQKVSDYALKNGYLDYRTLAKCFDCVLCNEIINAHPDVWDYVESGELYEYFNADGDYITREEYEKDEENNEERMKDFFQFYIVSSNALELLKEAGEVVLYCDALDVYIWCVDHYGTSWDYVLTNIKLQERE